MEEIKYIKPSIEVKDAVVSFDEAYSASAVTGIEFSKYCWQF